MHVLFVLSWLYLQVTSQFSFGFTFCRISSSNLVEYSVSAESELYVFSRPLLQCRLSLKLNRTVNTTQNVLKHNIQKENLIFTEKGKLTPTPSPYWPSTIQLCLLPTHATSEGLRELTANDRTWRSLQSNTTVEWLSSYYGLTITHARLLVLVMNIVCTWYARHIPWPGAS